VLPTSSRDDVAADSKEGDVITPKTLDDRERRLLKRAHGRFRTGLARTYAQALDQVGLGREYGPFLRVLSAAADEGRGVSVLSEFPQFMYAIVWPRSKVVKIGVTLRRQKPGQAVGARVREHLASFDAGESPSVFWWAGSREKETRLVQDLGKRDQLPGHREWFRLTRKVTRVLRAVPGNPIGL